MASSSQIASQGSILIVEDNALIRCFLVEALRKRYPALTLYEADNGNSGFELFCQLRPEIVLTDMVMPELDGMGMVRKIREVAPRNQIVVLTAHSETDLLLDCIRIGVSRYLLKPIVHEFLFDAVDDCLRRIKLEKKVEWQQEELRRHRDHLDLLVKERTAELELRNDRLEVEISERKRAEELLRVAEEARKATVEVLQICNRAESALALARELARFFQQLTGCDAVGLRLREGEDCPYYESRGFSHNFLLAESTLCAADPLGEMVRDGAGRVQFACLCGLVLDGRAAMVPGFCTPEGSVWTNSTAELASKLGSGMGPRLRYRCLEEGYQSVALIPLRSQGEIFGLLQLNCFASGLFDLNRIAFLEGLASYAAIALAKRKTDEALRRSELALSEAQKIGRIGSYLYDLPRDRWSSSHTLDELYGITKEYDRSMAGWGGLVHPSQRHELLGHLRDCIAQRRRFDREFRIVRPRDGAERWLHGVGEVEYGGDGSPMRMVGTVQDITERRSAEDEILRHARRLIEVEEELRKRIAMELHDDIAQDLTALGLNLSFIGSCLLEGAEGALGERLTESRTLTKEIGRRVRNLMTDLRPVQLEEYGLAASVRGHSELYSLRTGIAVVVLADQEFPRLPVLQEISLFRIVQEALTNVAKHAEATRVVVVMRRDADTLRLSIADDGKGFPLRSAASPGDGWGWGVANMRERTEMIGGVFGIDSLSGAGTTITVELREG